MDGLWDRIAGAWNQFAGDIRAKWADLTDDDLEEIKGNRQTLIGKLQERYGITKDEIEKQISEWEDALGKR